MPGWLVRSDYVRSVEQVAEFLRLAAGTATSAELFRHACETLQRLLSADAVVLWKLDPSGERLEAVAAAPPEWGMSGDLSFEIFPDLRQVLRQTTPQWLEKVAARWQPRPPFLLEARKALLVPVAARGRALGCLLAVFSRSAPRVMPEEQEAGLALGHALAFLLEAETLQRQGQAQRRLWETRRRVEKELCRSALVDSGLSRLPSAALELTGAMAVGLYEREPLMLRRVAMAGASQLLPGELPVAGAAAALPWQRALAEGSAVELRPAEVARELEGCLPQLAHAAVPLQVVPLASAGIPLGVLLICQSPDGGECEQLEGTALALLATAALENARWRRLQEHYQLRYQSVFDEMREGALFVEAAGRIVAANAMLLRWTGYAQEEVKKRLLADLVQPGDWEPIGRWLQSVPEKSFHSTARWRLKSGACRALELTLHALPESFPGQTLFLVLARDTEQESESQYLARINQARLEGLLDSVHDGVWLISPAGTVEFVNHRLAQLFGVNVQELGPGLTQREAVERLKDKFRYPEAVLANWNQLQASPEEMFWDELELLEPRRRVLERFTRPLFDSRQQLVGRLEVYRDITAQRLLEDKVLQREKLAAVGQLVSGIAHELNNPLTAVTGYAQLLLSSRLGPALQEKVQRLYQEGERAGRIVRNLLLFARGSRTEKVTVDLPVLLEQTISLRAYEFKVQNIKVAREYASDAPPVLADPHQLQQVFLNIFLNAEQAMRSQRDHGQLTLRTRWRPEENRVRVEIANDGPPISAPLLPYIFEPFFTTKPPGEGTGLGLSISHAIVKEHGGEISVQSAAGSEVTFIVELPAQSPPAAASTLEDRQARRGVRVAVRQAPRILVVDDEQAVAELIADALRQHGYEVSVHTESRRALDEALSQPFSLAICDIRMPEVDGRAFHRTLREQHCPLASRLLFTTGDTLARETAEFLEQVRLPYLAKPFHIEELRSRVRELLQRFEDSSAGEQAAAPA